MVALFFALLLALPAAEGDPCDRREELRAAVNTASRSATREESLQALADHMQAVRLREEEPRCGPDFLRTEALAHLFLGEYVEALGLLDQLLADYPNIDAYIEGLTHVNRGYLLVRLGRSADAALAYAAAAEHAGDVDPAIGAHFLMEASKTFRLLRRPESATAYLEAVARIAEESGDVSLKARVLTERAFLHFPAPTVAGAEADSLSRISLAHAYQAVGLYREDPSSDTAYQHFRTLIYIADNHRRLNEEDLMADAIAEAERLLPRVAPRNPVARPRLSLLSGHLAKRRGDVTEAERHYQRSVRIARQLGETQIELDALRFLGDLAALTDPSRAARLYTQAIDLAEDRRESMGLQDWSVSAFEQYQTPYRSLVRTLLLMDHPEEAFAQLDAVRARYLRDLRASAALRRTLGPEQQQALASLNEQLRDERAALANPDLSPQDYARHEYAAAQIRAQMQELSGARPAPPRKLDVRALQAALGRRNQHMVTYFLDRDVAVAFVVRPDTFAVRKLPEGVGAIREASKGLEALWPRPGERPQAPPLDMLHRLYALTVAPIADLLPDGDPVVIVPEGPLSALPFALLVEKPTDRFRYDDAPFLLRRHPLSTELAASLVMESGIPATRSASDRPFVAFGRSRFEGAPEAARASGALSSLPYVPEELERVVTGLAGGEAYLDEAATEHAFDELLGTPRLLHLATHVRPDAELPLYSHAVLWDDPDAPDDGILHAYEIEDRLLDLDLVVLSGCETGFGVGRQGEGMQSLQYAFRAAGARSVVATLWQVDDRATAYVMDRLYHHLGQGARKDVALQRAQLDYLDAHDGALASPLLWAAAVLYGDPSALGWTDDRGGALGWVLLGLGALALGALPIAYRRRIRARLQR